MSDRMQALPCGPWRVFLGYLVCISPVPVYPNASHRNLGILLYRCIDPYLYLAMLQQIHCILLYPTASSCIRTHLATSSCIYLLYPAVSHCISPPRKRDNINMTKNTLKGRASPCSPPGRRTRPHLPPLALALNHVCVSRPAPAPSCGRCIFTVLLQATVIRRAKRTSCSC